jgi:hypothetical protein
MPGLFSFFAFAAMLDNETEFLFLRFYVFTAAIAVTLLFCVVTPSSLLVDTVGLAEQNDSMFKPEDGGRMLHRNVSTHLLECMVL